MSSGWPTRRPLVPVALAGLVGTLIGIFTDPRPVVWAGAALGLAGLAWWGPRKLKTPAVWLFVAAVFVVYAGARVFAPTKESLWARAGEEGGTAILQGWIAELPAERTWEGGKKVLEAEMKVDSIQGEKGWEKCPGRVLLRIDPAPLAGLPVAERVEVAGYLTLPGLPKNPGEFNRRTWLRSRGIDFQCRVRAEDLKTLGPQPGVWLERTARRAERGKVGNGWLERTARRAERGKPSPAEAGLGKDWKAGRPERPKEIKWDNLSPIS